MAKLFNEIKNQLNKDIKNKFDELEVEKAKFIEAAGIFCADWIRGYAERESFQYNFQVTEKLGLKWREFKHEVYNFCQEVPELARKEFSQKSYWQHYKISEADAVEPETFKAPYHVDGPKGPEILDSGIRLVVGNLGPILKKYGYLDPEKDSKHQWEQKPGVFYYPFPLNWSKNLSDIAESYAIKLEKLQELNFKLSETIREEKEYKIKRNLY